MAVERFTGSQTDSARSGADLRGKEFHLAMLEADGDVVTATLGAKVVGVISEGKDVGLHSSFKTGNQLKAVADVAIVRNAKLASSADGQVKVAAAGQHVFGTAKSDADAGELVEFYMDQEGPSA